MMNEQMDRHEKAEEERFERLGNEILDMKKDTREIRQDLNEHRSNTELHGGSRGKKVS